MFAGDLLKYYNVPTTLVTRRHTVKRIIWKENGSYEDKLF